MRNLYLFLIFFALSITSAFAQKEIFVDVYKEYKNGSYLQALDLLNKIEGDEKILSTKYYLEGLCHSRLQNFGTAIKNFKEALRHGNESQDIYYELGQAEYAANELSEARRSFIKSFRRNYNKATSLYYMGHISQILEEFTKARIYYKQLAKSDNVDIKLRQISALQTAEVSLSLIEQKAPDKLHQYIRSYVLPIFDNAVKIDNQSAMAEEIKERKLQIMIKYGLHPYFLQNGRRVPDKGYYLSFSQKLEFDNNITLATDQSATEDTELESYILNTSFVGRFRMIFNRRTIIQPELTGEYLYHTDRDHSNVYKNDSYTLTPAIRTQYEHKFKGKPASFLLDFDYSQVARDRDENHERIFYARTYAYTIGERVNLFSSAGDTTFKLMLKNYRAYTESLDSDTYAFSIDQMFIRKNGHFILFFFQADFIDNYNAPSTSTDSYLFLLSYIWPEIYPDYTLSMNVSTTFLDTKEQSDTRGTEKTYTPSIKLSKSVNDYMKLKIYYEYTKNTSKDTQNYDYTKHVSGFEFSLDF